MEILDHIIQIINHNPFIFLSVFALSLIANALQVYTFVQDRQRLKEELVEKSRLLKLVDTYEYILNLAKQNIRTEKQLRDIEEKIAQKTNLIEEMSERIGLLQRAAQRRLVAQALERELGVLLEAYNNINYLRREYQSLEDLPDIPPSERKGIEEQVSIAVKRPYELPKSFVFKSALLVLIVLLLPWPVDNLFILAFLVVYIETFFEAIVIYGNPNLLEWTAKNANWLGLGSSIAAWLSVVDFMNSYLFNNFIIPYIPWDMRRTAEVILCVIIGFLHWRLIKKRALSPLTKAR